MTLGSKPRLPLSRRFSAHLVAVCACLLTAVVCASVLCPPPCFLCLPVCSRAAQPEGFAVAFSAMTPTGGPLMCFVIACHNVPEGLVIAAPIYAATGSKARALAISTLSGLSEPLGASVALFVFRPWVNSIQRLDFVLAFVGGIMLAVCGLELWPEGRKCRQDVRLVQGVVLGAVLMGWTLYVGV